MEALLVRLAGYKAAGPGREAGIFTCMIHNLLDEYRFFNKYPEKELAITAQLFGGCIRAGLLESTTLALALRYVADALRAPAGSKMFGFGLTALQLFEPQAHRWRQYTSHLLQVGRRCCIPAQQLIVAF